MFLDVFQNSNQVIFSIILLRSACAMLKKFYIKKEFFVQQNDQNLDIKDYYEFLSTLGRGSFGIVYKAQLKYYPYSYRAIKRIKKIYIKNPADNLKEYAVLTSLDHPSIIKIYQTFEDEENFFLVIDYCEGGELFTRLSKAGSFTESEARGLFIQMVNIIKYCHSNKVIHRDLKPQNFLLSSSKRLDLMLIDFGLCFRWKKNLRKEIDIQEGKKIIGTAYYMAPEIFTGTYDERCDIWSLGIILFMLITGQPPVNGTTVQEIIQNIKAGKLNLNVLTQKSVNAQVANLILRILVKQQERISISEIMQHRWITSQIPENKLNINFEKIKTYSKFSKQFKLLALNYIASQLSQKEITLLGKVFLDIDKNKDGYLTVQQLCEYFNKHDENPEFSQLKDIIQSMDVDNNGKLAYNEFISACLSKSAANSREYLKFAFDYFDLDHDGKISPEQLKHILNAYQKEYKENEELVNRMLQECDTNKDNQVDFEQFYKYIIDKQ